MKISKTRIITYIVIIFIAYFLGTYQLPYYIQKPGNTEPLNPIVEVEESFTSAGEMHLVTVSGLQATPIHYLLAMVLPHNDINPIHEVFPEGISPDDYMHAQLQVMESSQEASLVVAYEAAEKDIQIEYVGVYVVSVVDDMPADGKLEMGDRIINIDGIDIKESTDLINYIDTKNAGDTIEIEFLREEEIQQTEITLETFANDPDKVGIGITLVTDREVTVDPAVTFSSGNIGGPSAGLMFSLEIYDQLLEEDITKGYHIAGTGEVDYEGNVYRIGGVDKKIVAADKEGMDIFFVPFEDGAADSNYEVAIQTAEEIGTDMEIVGVDSFADALNYLEELPEKK
ncbi:SepM family pheromone-processing serine protease [Oceanobacillus sp. CAU 1775]